MRSCFLHTFQNVRNPAPMMWLPLLLFPLGRSSSWSHINSPESTGGPFTRQPQSLQDHQDSCHPSVWRRASGAWAGGVHTNTVIEAGEDAFMYLCFNYSAALSPPDNHYNSTCEISKLLSYVPKNTFDASMYDSSWRWVDDGAKWVYIWVCVYYFVKKKKKKLPHI